MLPEHKAFFEEQGLFFQKRLGSGGYGTVDLVFSQQYNECFALKRISSETFNDAELQCLKTVDDPRIVNLYNYYKIDDQVYLLMEYCPNDLEKLVAKEKLDQATINQYVLDVCMCIKACHDRNIAHSDIKPANFLVDRWGRIKISDFGLSSMHQSRSKCYKGTKMFMSPEIYLQQEFNPMKADIWALGVTLYFVATRFYPFYHKDPTIIMQKIMNLKYCEDVVEDPLLRHVISKCLNPNPHHRPKIDEVLELPFFNKDADPLSCPVIIGQRNASVLVRPKIPQKSMVLKPLPINKSSITGRRGSCTGRQLNRLKVIKIN